MNTPNEINRTDPTSTRRAFLRLCQVVRNGRIGQVKRVLAGVPKDPPPLDQHPAPMPVPPELDYPMWLGPAPDRPYTEQRPFVRVEGTEGWIENTWFKSDRTHRSRDRRETEVESRNRAIPGQRPSEPTPYASPPRAVEKRRMPMKNMKTCLLTICQAAALLGCAAAMAAPPPASALPDLQCPPHAGFDPTAQRLCPTTA